MRASPLGCEFWIGVVLDTVGILGVVPVDKKFELL